MSELIEFSEPTPVDSYGPGFFRIAGQVVQGSITVMPAGASPWGGYGDRAGIIASAGDIDVLIVGTGAEIAHLPVDFRVALESAGIGVEIMASPVACRNYNVLLGEGRRVGLALFAV